MKAENAGSLAHVHAVESQANGNAVPLTRVLDEGDGHAWATINIGSHFDLISFGNN